MNPHQHVLGLDGVYSTSADGRVVFTATRAPAQSELLDVTQRVHKRVLRWLKRHGAGDVEDKADDDEPSPAASCAQLSLRLGKLGYVDSDGVAHEPDPDHARFGMRKNTPWSAEHEGWSLHAGVTIAQGHDEGRERLCRYVVRHALSMERMSWTKDGRIAYQVKYPSSPWRKHIVPASESAEGCSHASATKADAPSPQRDKPRKPTGDASLLTSPAHSAPPDASSKPSWRPNTSYVPWPELLRHCFDVDILDCPRCHSRLTPVAVIRRQDVIDRILQHLALPLSPTQLGHADTVAFDVTGNLLPNWIQGVDPEPEPDARAPPNDWDGVDPPAPEA